MSLIKTAVKSGIIAGAMVMATIIVGAMVMATGVGWFAQTGDFEPLCQLMQQSCPLPLGGKSSALKALQYAAGQGQLAAQWKLARMYADGDGVPRDDLRAFSYFSQIANSHPDEAPGTPQARFVANAFVALGHD
jgi:TPR repeat protein